MINRCPYYNNVNKMDDIGMLAAFMTNSCKIINRPEFGVNAVV